MGRRSYEFNYEQLMYCYKCHKITEHRMIPRYNKCQECGMERDALYSDPTKLITKKQAQARIDNAALYKMREKRA